MRRIIRELEAENPELRRLRRRCCWKRARRAIALTLLALMTAHEIAYYGFGLSAADAGQTIQACVVGSAEPKQMARAKTGFLRFEQRRGYFHRNA